MSGLILRLAAPLQSWGEHSTFSERDTAAFPTRSGLIGLFAAARGLRRGEDLADYRELEFTVRIDQPGRHIVDFHTVGGGYPRSRTVLTAERTRRPKDAATLVSRRHYLSDAVFTVGVSGPGETLASIAHQLAHPVWAPYLGRRSCPPDQPLLLRTCIEDVAAELLCHTPLAVRPWTRQHTTIDFVYERPAVSEQSETNVYELQDVPTTFAPLARVYGPRQVYRTAQSVSAPTYHVGDTSALIEYVRGAGA